MGPARGLDTGTAGDTGALRWVDSTGHYIPATSTHQRFTRPRSGLDSFDWSGQECSVDIALQVPIDLVYAAIAEVTATHRRPSCVEWTPAANDLAREHHPQQPVKRRG